MVKLIETQGCTCPVFNGIVTLPWNTRNLPSPAGMCRRPEAPHWSAAGGRGRPRGPRRGTCGGGGGRRPAG